MTLVFFLEERSAQELLSTLLPKVLPPQVDFVCVPHEGKSDLRRRLHARLAAWNAPDCSFVVVHDQDHAECLALKRSLEALVPEVRRANTIIRIACRELESWILGDLDALGAAFEKPGLSDLQTKASYRTPDALGNPSQELRRLLPAYSKVSGARRAAEHMEPDRNASHSFQVFMRAVRRLSEAQA